MLLDAHCHLQESAFHGDLDQVLARAKAAGVGRFISAGVDERDWAALARIAERYGHTVWPQYGVHPWSAADCSPDWRDRLESYLNGRSVGVGEIGLDRLWKRKVVPEVQESVFRDQWLVACRRRAPMTVHCVRAWPWLLEVLEGLPPAPCGFLLHGYGGTAQMLPELVARGALFSVGGRVVDPQNATLRAVSAAIPLDRLLIESDAPAMSPREPYAPPECKQPDGSLRNEPQIVARAAREIAALRDMPVKLLVEAVSENAVRLFGTCAFEGA